MEHHFEMTGSYCWDEISTTQPSKITQFMTNEVGIEYDFDAYESRPNIYALTVWDATPQEVEKITRFINQIR